MTTTERSGEADGICRGCRGRICADPDCDRLLPQNARKDRVFCKSAGHGRCAMRDKNLASRDKWAQPVDSDLSAEDVVRLAFTRVQEAWQRGDARAASLFTGAYEKLVSMHGDGVDREALALEVTDEMRPDRLVIRRDILELVQELTS